MISMKLIPKLKIIYLLLTSLFLLSLSGCTKERPDDKPEYDGKLVGQMNGVEWVSSYHEAFYYPQYHQLLIRASDSLNHYHLTAGINLDSISPLKSYVLESNGNNVAEVVSGMVQYNSDHNIEDAGGNFVLSDLDTLAKTMNGTLHFISYSADRQQKLTFSSDEIKDIPLTIVNTPYDGSIASCIVEGVKTTQWQSKNFFAKVTCWSGGDNKTLEVHIESPIGGYPNHHFLLLRIPLVNLIGTYPVLADLPPYFYCGTKNITSRYSIDNLGESYYPTGGNINITLCDTALKILKANFNIAYTDTTARKESIQVLNGQIQINKWEE